jgi:hypothetical protein
VRIITEEERPEMIERGILAICDSDTTVAATAGLLLDQTLKDMRVLDRR